MLSLKSALIRTFCALFFLFLSTNGLLSQSDTLIINMKNNSISKISISDIKTIKFENLTGIDEVNPVNSRIDNYPNPFTESTTLEYELKSSGTVNIAIYSNSGRLVKDIECIDCKEGINRFQWNCLDNNGEKVTPGIYYFEVSSGNEKLSKKMILVK